jgi:hypothetical protein
MRKRERVDRTGALEIFSSIERHYLPRIKFEPDAVEEWVCALASICPTVDTGKIAARRMALREEWPSLAAFRRAVDEVRDELDRERNQRDAIRQREAEKAEVPDPELLRRMRADVERLITKVRERSRKMESR